MTPIKGIAVASIIALGSAPAMASVIIAPVSATIDVGGPGFGPIDDTFNQSGLSTGYTAGVTDFDSYIASDPTHDYVFSGNEWFSNEGTSSAQVTYDLGSVFGIDTLALWNEDTSGIGLLELSYSVDGLNFLGLGSYNPANNPVNADYSAQLFSFAPVNAQYVRFGMSGCPQPDGTNFQACAIGEVAFRTAEVNAAVPEPGTWAMMLLGFGAMGWSFKRRRKLALA